MGLLLNFDELSAKQKQALEALAEGVPVNQIARRLKIRRETLWRWRQIPAFARELQNYRQNALAKASHELHELTSRATEVLSELLESDHDNIRFAAAKEVFARVNIEEATATTDKVDDSRDLSKLSSEELRTLRALLDKCH